MEANAVVNSLLALVNADADTAEGFVIAAIYYRALTTGDTPRAVTEALFRAVPNDEAWPAMRDALIQVIEESDPE